MVAKVVPMCSGISLSATKPARGTPRAGESRADIRKSDANHAGLALGAGGVHQPRMQLDAALAPLSGDDRHSATHMYLLGWRFSKTYTWLVLIFSAR